MILSWQMTVLTFGFATGLMLVSYRDYARAKGWPIGAMITKPVSWPAMFGFIAMVFALGRGFLVFDPWGIALLVPVFGFFLGFFLISVFRSWSPLFGIVAGLVAFFASPYIAA